MAREGVLKLYFGESNLPTPPFIRQAADQAMRDGYTYYTQNAGIPSLRETIAQYYQQKHGVTLDPLREIVVTNGGVQALNVTMRCLLDAGDEAVILTPGWHNQMAITQMSHATPVEVPLVMQDGRYTVDFAAVERAITPRTKFLCYTSPSNPLGWVATVEEQRQLLEICRRHGIWLYADEVYERLTFDVPLAPSILRLADRDDGVVVVQSFSKSYCMTGWRLGWVVSRRDLCARATVLNEFIISNAASFTQRAAESALLQGEPFIAELMTMLRANRDFCVAAMSRMPRLQLPKPEGAFYLFPRVEGVQDSFDFCKRFLEAENVGLAPGVAFGAGGEGCIRICYAAERPIVEEAMNRLERFLPRY